MLCVLGISRHDIVSASSLDQFKSQIKTHYILINCKYIVCSRRCIVVTIDGGLHNVDVDVDDITSWCQTKDCFKLRLLFHFLH